MCLYASAVESSKIPTHQAWIWLIKSDGVNRFGVETTEHVSFRAKCTKLGTDEAFGHSLCSIS